MEAKNSMEPVFAWSVPHTLKKRNQTIAKVKAKYWLKTHKFRIKVPKSMKQAIEFNRENVNKLWWDAVCKDMKSICPAFEPWEKPEGDIPPGYQEIKCHLIFDIKMGGELLSKVPLRHRWSHVGYPYHTYLRFCSVEGFGTHCVNYCGS